VLNSIKLASLTSFVNNIAFRAFAKQGGGIDEKAGIAFANLLLSDKGQRLVEEAGYVPQHSQTQRKVEPLAMTS